MHLVWRATLPVKGCAFTHFAADAAAQDKLERLAAKGIKPEEAAAVSLLSPASSLPSSSLLLGDTIA